MLQIPEISFCNNQSPVRTAHPAGLPSGNEFSGKGSGEVDLIEKVFEHDR